MKQLLLLFFLTVFLITLNAQVKEFYGVLPKDKAADTSAGLIFKLDSVGTNYEELYRFPKTLGGELFNLTKVSNGKYYGFARHEFIEYNPATSKVSYLLSFKRDSMINDGLFRSGPFVLMPNNKLYATTERGGINQHGILYSIDLGSLIYKKIIEFDDATIGSIPSLTLIEKSNGRLLGTLSSTINSFVGGVFEFDTSNDSLYFLKQMVYTSSVGSVPSCK